MLEDTWTIRNWSGRVQYTNSKSGDDLMMLPADIVLVTDPSFKAASELYANDYELFAKEFAVNFKKLTGASHARTHARTHARALQIS
jgi:cytochrome c peroxidase